MQDNHTTRVDGDGVHFSVRPESTVATYWMTFIVMTVVFFFVGVMLTGDNESLILLDIVIGMLGASLVIFLMPANRLRRRFAFVIRRDAVEIEPAKPSDGINITALASRLNAGTPTIVNRAEIREVVVRNTMAGTWTHSLNVANQNYQPGGYIGIGSGGIALAGAMSSAEHLAAGFRKIVYATTAKPRLAKSFYVALRLGKVEHVIGGGLDEQGAADLASDVLAALTNH